MNDRFAPSGAPHTRRPTLRYDLAAEHRWYPDAAAELHSGAGVYVFQIVDAGDAPELTWDGQSDDSGSALALARVFARALVEAADKLDEIRGAS